MKRKNKFTLVELLVVIAIISILAGMLLPALENALSAAERIKCSSQIKQVMLAISMYSNDNEGYIPHSIYSTVDYAQHQMVSTGMNNRPASGLGLLLYNDYVPSGTLFNCPTEKGGINEKSAVDYNMHQKSVEGYRNAVFNDNSWHTSYAYRGHLWREGANSYPAHGRAPSINWRYLNHIEKRPCTSSYCGGTHSILALVADDFTWRPGSFECQGLFHHETAYNVGYSDGHSETINDNGSMITDSSTSFYAAYNNYELKYPAEDIFDAFDGDIGNVNNAAQGSAGAYIYGLK
ncbi:MAG: type II secretion system protein [Planctomycetota bacterium]|jgi:prepilin-type N-terminal cleavage/methylation domain-containing protein